MSRKCLGFRMTTATKPTGMPSKFVGCSLSLPSMQVLKFHVWPSSPGHAQTVTGQWRSSASVLRQMTRDQENAVWSVLCLEAGEGDAPYAPMHAHNRTRTRARAHTHTIYVTNGQQPRRRQQSRRPVCTDCRRAQSKALSLSGCARRLSAVQEIRR